MDDINKKDAKTLEMVYNIHKNTKKYEGWFTNPYDDYGVDFIVDFSVKKVELWNNALDDESREILQGECLYEGVIHIKINKILIGYEASNDWEQVYYEDDLPERAWDDLKENVQEDVSNFLPHICLDVNLFFD